MFEIIRTYITRYSNHVKLRKSRNKSNMYMSYGTKTEC